MSREFSKIGKISLLALSLCLLIVGVVLVHSSNTKAHFADHNKGGFRIWYNGNHVYGQWTAPDNHRFDAGETFRMIYVDDPITDCETAYAGGGSSQDTDFNNDYSARRDTRKLATVIAIQTNTNNQKTTESASTNSLVASLAADENKYVSPTQAGVHGKWICAEIKTRNTTGDAQQTYEYWASDTAINIAPPSNDPPEDDPYVPLPRDQTPPRVGVGTITGDTYSVTVTDSGSGLRNLSWGLLTDQSPNNQCNAGHSFPNIVSGDTITIIDITDQADFSICIKAYDQVGNTAIVRREVSRTKLQPPPTPEETIPEQTPPTPEDSNDNDQTPSSEDTQEMEAESDPVTPDNTQPDEPVIPSQTPTSESSNNESRSQDDDSEASDQSSPSDTANTTEEETSQEAPSSNPDQEQETDSPSNNDETDLNSQNQTNDSQTSNDDDNNSQDEEDSSLLGIILGGLLALGVVVVVVVLVQRGKGDQSRE